MKVYLWGIISIFVGFTLIYYLFIFSTKLNSVHTQAHTWNHTGPPPHTCLILSTEFILWDGVGFKGGKKGPRPVQTSLAEVSYFHLIVVGQTAECNQLTLNCSLPWETLLLSFLRRDSKKIKGSDAIKKLDFQAGRLMVGLRLHNCCLHTTHLEYTHTHKSI